MNRDIKGNYITTQGAIDRVSVMFHILRRVISG